jgi:hypothetical protein
MTASGGVSSERAFAPIPEALEELTRSAWLRRSTWVRRVAVDLDGKPKL